MSLSGRERGEGFLLITACADQSEQGEGFQDSSITTGPVIASERGEGFHCSLDSVARAPALR